MIDSFRDFVEAILTPQATKLFKYKPYDKTYLGSHYSVKIDKTGRIVPLENEDYGKPHFELHPKEKRLVLQEISPQSVDFRKIIPALRSKYHDIDDWEVAVMKQAGHMETGKEPAKTYRTVGYWMGQETINLNNRMPRYVYHGTSTNQWYDGIKQKGLMSRGMTGSSGGYGSQNLDALSRADLIYLSTHPDAAARSAARQAAKKYGGQPLILRIDASGLDMSRFEPDEDSRVPDARSSIRIMSTFGYRGRIPPGIIEPFLLGKEEQTKTRLFASWHPFKDVPVAEHPMTQMLKSGRFPYTNDAEYYALLDAGVIGRENEITPSGHRSERTVLKKNVDDAEIRRILKNSSWAVNVKAILKDLDDGYRGNLLNLKGGDHEKARAANPELFDKLVASRIVTVRKYDKYTTMEVDSWSPEAKAITLAKSLGNVDFRELKKEIGAMATAAHVR